MKLKTTVALSISLLGLASTMAYAAVGATNAQNADSKARVAKLETALDRNQGQAVSFGDLPAQGWEKRITVSGMANADLTWSNRTPIRAVMPDTKDSLFVENNDLNEQSFNDVGIANANLFVDANVNSFTKVHGTLAYWGEGQNANVQPHNGSAESLVLDEAYVLMHDFANSPLYARVGKQYVDSGFYTRFPVVAPFTQMLTQTQATAVTVGLNSAAGYNVSAFVFNGSNKSTRKKGRRRINAGGVSAGFSHTFNNVGMNLGVSFMNNMANTDFFGTHEVDDIKISEKHVKRVGLLAIHLGADYNNFDLAVDYAGATSKFDVKELKSAKDATKGAKPRAVHTELGFKVPTMNRKSRISVAYDRSWDAVHMNSDIYAPLPRDRFAAAYNIELASMTDVSLVLRRDKDYKKDNGGTGLKATTGILRLGVKFA